MGIYGTYISPNINIDSIISNKIDLAYYILDNITFNLNTSGDTEFIEVNIIFSCYKSIQDRHNRVNLIGQIKFNETHDKKWNRDPNLWTIYYTKYNLYLKNYLENVLRVALKIDPVGYDNTSLLNDLPTEYQNIVILYEDF
jgi:hypothetical protein